MVGFTLTTRCHLIRLASPLNTSFRLAKFGWAPFADLRVQRLATKHAEHRIHKGWVKTLVPFQTVCGPKFMKFWKHAGDHCAFQQPCPVVYARFRSEHIRHSVSKSSKNRTNVKVFWLPTFLGRTTPTFLQHIVSVIYRSPFGKVWLSSVCWPPSAKPGNGIECGIYRGWVKMQAQFWAACGPKCMLYWDDVGDPL